MCVYTVPLPTHDYVTAAYICIKQLFYEHVCMSSFNAAKQWEMKSSGNALPVTTLQSSN